MKATKKGMALGALMAFVITGSAMAAETLETIYVGSDAFNKAVVSGKLTVELTDRKFVYSPVDAEEQVSADLTVNAKFDTASQSEARSLPVVKVEGGKGTSINGDINYNLLSANKKDYYYVTYLIDNSNCAQVGDINVVAEDIGNVVMAVKPVRLATGSSMTMNGDINLSLKNMDVQRVQMVAVSENATITHTGNLNLYAEDLLNSNSSADCPTGYWVEDNVDASTLNGDINMTFINKKDGKGLLKNIYGVAVRNSTFNHNGDINISVAGDVSKIVNEYASNHTIYGYVESGTGKYNQSESGVKTLSFGAVDDEGNNVPFISGENNALKWNFANFDVIKVTEGSSLYIDNTQEDEYGVDNGDFVSSENKGTIAHEGLISSIGGSLNLAGNSMILEDDASVVMTNLNTDDSKITVGAGAKLQVKETLDGDTTLKVETLEKGQVKVGSATGEITAEISSDNFGSDVDAGLEKLKMVVLDENDETAADKLVGTAGALYDSVSADVDSDGTVGEVQKTVAAANLSVNDMVAIGLMSWRAEMNDMNKRMGELRNANGEHGIWVRMVNGESEYGNVTNEYKQYQMGYDEKLSVDKRWTVGMAVSYTDAENNFAQGSGESTNKAWSVYGSKLNDDGTFVDLIGKYARLENDFVTYSGMGDADYKTHGYSLSAEFGKRIQQGKGLWIEPQVELTYGKVSAVDYVTKNGVNVAQDGMESLVGRVGFSLGKDVKDGNVYARASYLYDFDGETSATLNGVETLENDLGGGWWEVGVGANINLSKATYIYADVEKTFGGEVDTNWQWNLGVRYSF